jgi:hypothetical protein
MGKVRASWGRGSPIVRRLHPRCVTRRTSSAVPRPLAPLTWDWEGCGEDAVQEGSGFRAGEPTSGEREEREIAAPPGVAVRSLSVYF